VACLPIFFSGHAIARWEGAVFFGYYVAFTGYLILDAQDHAALGTLSAVMLWFVVPLTVLTLVVSAYQAWRAHGLAGPDRSDPAPT
jgi:cation:H+ antiporter